MPLVHSAFPAGVLLTNGLGHNACSGGLITAAKWSLFGCDASIVIVPAVSPSGGGSRVFLPGEIQNFYQPIDQTSDNNLSDYKPIDVEYKPKNVIKVKIKINDIESEREYVLKRKPYKMLVKILNIINITDRIAKITLKNIKTKIHNISVILKNIKLKRN
jgi:hypothetical protein